MRKVLSIIVCIWMYTIPTSTFGQCGSETVQITDYCNNQYAEFTTALAGNEILKWYSSVPSDPASERINKSDDGSYFASEFRYTSGDGPPNLPLH